ncbi:hypothetical protein FJZ48_01765 [Candidatus Uhrbacteria bacterium]|nr:hypothetical protein [Candidatus Uhrbacteria bacterium]
MLKRLGQLLCLAGFGLLGCLLFIPQAKAETSAEIWEATTIQACQTLFGLVKPSSTEPVIEAVIETVSSTEEMVKPATTPPPTPSPQVGESVNTHLMALSANPTDGKEWIEVSGAGPHLVGWHLEDAVGKIHTFTSSSLEAVDASSSRLRITLNSARLNNNGDSVFLKHGETIVDQTTFGEMKKDQLWIRSPINNELWELSPPNDLPEPEPIEEEEVVTSTHMTMARASPKLTQVKTVLATAAPKTSSKTTPKTSTKMTTSKTISKATALPTLVPLSMVQTLNSGIRIQVVGTVASVPKLLAQGQFVIQNPDGRGLLVTGNTRELSPEFGTMIEVTGTLLINDRGVTLRMMAKDEWNVIKKSGDIGPGSAGESEIIAPRVVDLNAPAQEDAWSLVHVTGTVLNVSGSLVHLDVEGLPLTLVVKPVLRYRAERILSGDVIRVKGLFDSRDDIAKVIPRVAEEIEIMSHKQKASTGTLAESQTPIWMPFGAAGATVVLTHGIKRAKKIHEKYRLNKLLAQASKQLVQKPHS